MLNESDVLSYLIDSKENSPIKLSKNKYNKENSGSVIDNTNETKLEQEPIFTKSEFTLESTNCKRDIKICSVLLELKRKFFLWTCFFVICFSKKLKLHCLKCYVFLICLVTIFTQMIQGGYIKIIIPSLQNHFNLSTSNIGYILSSYDIMNIIISPIVAYIGNRFNKPKIIGLCGLIYVLGAILFTLPNFYAQKYTVNINNIIKNQLKNESYLCSDNEYTRFNFYANFSNNKAQQTNESNCQRDFSNIWPFYNFIFSQLFMAVGISPIFSLGTTYLCDNLDARLHAFYLSFLFGSNILGSAIGYILASYFVSIWINKFTESYTPISENDSNWVGLWFLGFYISAGFILIISLIMITFPKYLSLEEKKNFKKLNLPNARQNSNNQSRDSNESNKLNDIKSDLEKNYENEESTEAVENNLHVLNTISSRVESNLSHPIEYDKSISVDNTIMSNDLVTNENQNFTKYRPSRNKTTCFNFSSIKHNFFLFRFKLINFFKCLVKVFLNYRYTLLILTISTDYILISIFSNYMILYSQDSYQLSSLKSSLLVGGIIVSSSIFGIILGGFLVRKFNLNIEGCTRLIMICSILIIGGIFGLIFFKCESNSSIGWDSFNNIRFNSNKICNKNCNCDSSYNPVCGNDGITYISPCLGYTGCSCLSSSNSNKTDEILAKQGPCSKGCDNKLIIFLSILFAVVFTESICMTPAIILALKIIDKLLQSFSLGLMRCINSLFAYITLTIILSPLIDNTCISWNSKCKGDKGTCFEYNNKQFHMILFGSLAGIKIVSSCILITFTFFIHKSYIRRNHYIGNLKLNHDIMTVQTPKQKYMIDSEVACTSTNRNIQIEEKRDGNLKNKKPKKWINNVFLISQQSFDEFTSFDSSHTSDFFVESNKIINHDPKK